ncbi:50S ribosomal protein L18 [Peptoniphilus sp. MSJ-1]|uniref:Large ribosomal subunit protein uL18 n=1 Tax=Peptoniphilus ovalis TaxID=2841503 RepID=A0ABS6FHA1_9FIRM|nr:50S ribosomal protein L18 [Peptoniphilus ovalis]
MLKRINRNENRQKRHKRLRNHISGTSQRPRLSIYRSASHIYAQIINDEVGHTICSASTLDKSLNLEQTGNIDAAKAVGTSIANKAKEAGVDEVVFDRGGYVYHGKVKALAEAAREAGLKF